MNRLPGHMVVTHVAKRQIDPYEGCAATADEFDIGLTAISLGLPQKTIRLALQRPELRRGWCSQLRYCPRCMSQLPAQLRQYPGRFCASNCDAAA